MTNNIQEVVTTLILMALAIFLGTIIAWLIALGSQDACLKKLNEYENKPITPLPTMTQERWMGK